MDKCIVFSCADPAQPIPIASFALDSEGNGHFGYGLRYIEQRGAFSIDPVHLPLSPEVFVIQRGRDGSYGALSDAGPNAWGVRLTSSLFRALNRTLPRTPVDWFLQSWHYGSGCLGFSTSPQEPPSPGVTPAPLGALTNRLVALIGSLAQQEAGDTSLDQEALRLFFPGASLGGMRPKTVVMHEGREHIAKFGRPGDPFDVPAVEYATMRLAHAAKINVPDFELVHIENRSVLIVARFDRDYNGGRKHYLSARSLLNIDALSGDGHEYKTRYSYAGIAEAMRSINDQAVADSHELFRRMVLNILVGNVDDHLRNHGLIMVKPGKFSLSPAFDIVPHLEAAIAPQSIGVGEFGTASTLKNAISQCGRFFLTPAEATNIIGEVREAVSKWRMVFREAGIGKDDINTVATCFSAADQAERISGFPGQSPRIT